MKTFPYSLFASLGAVIWAALMMIGCSSSGSPSGGYMQHKGATFTFKIYEIDSSGNYSLPGLEVDSVEEVGLSIGGMTNVSRLLARQGGSSESFTYYIAYQNNGDFAVGDSVGDEIDWMTFPSGSRKSIVIIDTMFSPSESEFESISYQGPESVTTLAGTFNAIKLREDYRYTYLSGYSSYSDNNTEDIWYAPQLGMFIKIQLHFSDSYTDYNGIRTTRQYGRLFVLDNYK